MSMFNIGANFTYQGVDVTICEPENESEISDSKVWVRVTNHERGYNQWVNKSSLKHPLPKESEHDPVNNPSHYDLFADGTQSMDIIEAGLTLEEFKGFLKGNCLKYRLRAGKKDKLEQDIDKANWYANKLTEVMNNAN